jgi:hypothetical protein
MSVRRLVIGLASLIGATTFSGVAAGANLTLGSPVLVSGPSPFVSCTAGSNGISGASSNAVNSEVEPFVAANPVVAGNVVGVYQQDRWNDGGAHGLMSASSFNSGGSWALSFAAFSQCSGASSPWERASDPWVTFDRAGAPYAISLSFSADELNTSVQVAKSSDHGLTWGTPTVVQSDSSPIHFNDKESITGDPTRDGYVYAVWDRTTFPSEQAAINALLHSFAFRGQPMFARTSDAGAHWSTAVGMTNANVFTIGNQIAVLPSGRLVDIFNEGRGSGVQPSPNQTFEGVMLSDDAGTHWTPPIKIANYADTPLVDPDNGNPVRAGTNLPDIAVDPRNGTLYAVWADGRFSGGVRNDIVLAKSTDGGKTWIVHPSPINPVASAGAFNASVEVTSSGTVVITYYDFRNNTSAPGLPTDVWITHSDDGGNTWTEQHLFGSFDMEHAPDAGGYFLGDYQGLSPLGTGALAFFSVTDGPSGPSDIYSVSATP